MTRAQLLAKVRALGMSMNDFAFLIGRANPDRWGRSLPVPVYLKVILRMLASDPVLLERFKKGEFLGEDN